MLGFKPNSQVHSQLQLHFHLLICWNMSGNTSYWALKLPDEANAYMVFGIGLFKYSITNVNTECVIKYLKILSIDSGHKKREKRVGTLLSTGSLRVVDCIVTRRFSILIKNNTTRKKVGRITHYPGKMPVTETHHNITVHRA